MGLKSDAEFKFILNVKNFIGFVGKTEFNIKTSSSEYLRVTILNKENHIKYYTY